MDSGSVVSSISLTHSFEFAGRSAGSSSGRGRRTTTTMVQHQQQQQHDHHSSKQPGRTHSGAVDASNSANINDTDYNYANYNSDHEDAKSHHKNYYSHNHHTNPHPKHLRRRESVDTYQPSETISLGGVTDLSGDRPATHDTSRSMHLMRDASSLCGQPDRSNFREKMRHWTVFEDSNSPFLAPRPTTSLANQKSGGGGLIMTDLEREMSFLMSRPSTSNFPAKPKELIEPLDGLLPSESPVTQKKFLVLPSIGHGLGGLGLRRQRSNLETINQLDYSRNAMEDEADFFAGYHHNNNPSAMAASSFLNNKTKTRGNSKHSQNHNHHRHHRRQLHKQQKPDSPGQRPQHHTGLHQSGARSNLVHHQQQKGGGAILCESPSKAADTPLPLPPILKRHPKQPETRRRAEPRYLTASGADHSADDHEEDVSSRGSSSASCSSYDNRLEETLNDTDLEEVDEEDEEDDEEEEDLERFRLRTPETYRCGTPPAPITPPPGFR
ncbi:hypothetical protein EGW08_022560 [Elysia chlorotica]|uniref:Uncharacterized protein n=1 Tax=Elysia chlorotica TaxID=188477 RepID=A0A433SKM6_ELYCH|nr:hypothetical protein EGW08_022560 [Elysia chlorotica]